MSTFTVGRRGATFISDERGCFRIPPDVDPVPFAAGMPIPESYRFEEVEMEREDDEALREEDVTAADRLDDDVREADVEEGDPGED